MRFFVRISYKGTHFCGWQLQKNTPKTVQEKCNKALSKLLRQDIQTMGCGRTDTGVHARTFFFHFDSGYDIMDIENYVHRLNCMLSPDIIVHEICSVSDVYHARFSAYKRAYKYYIHQYRNCFLDEFSVYDPKKYDVSVMNTACNMLKTYTDFSAFTKSRNQHKTMTCNIYEAYWIRTDNTLVFYILANRFLRNMVRCIVGTILDVGLKTLSLEAFQQIIEQKDRRYAGVSAPAKGLFLEEVHYPNM